MRDVAARGEVALGTIYRYFPSKDALLLAVMVEWLGDLEQRVTRHPPVGATTVDRITDVLDRACPVHGPRAPADQRPGDRAMTAGDPAGVDAMVEVTPAWPGSWRRPSPTTSTLRVEAAAAKAIGHVWWSATIAWANGMGGMDWVAGECARPPS